MPKRTDIKSVLILGAGRLLSVKHVSLITLVLKLVKHFAKKVTELCTDSGNADVIMTDPDMADGTHRTYSMGSGS